MTSLSQLKNLQLQLVWGSACSQHGEKRPLLEEVLMTSLPQLKNLQLLWGTRVLASKVDLKILPSSYHNVGGHCEIPSMEFTILLQSQCFG